VRDIKFRQKLKPHFVRGSGEFHYWGYIDGDFTSPVGKNYCDTPDEQYTGLKDVNGVEIYEGDILQPSGYLRSDFAKCVVTFKKGMFCFEVCKPFIASASPLYRSLGRGKYANNEFKIIGNIHQNPELLEQDNG